MSKLVMNLRLVNRKYFKEKRKKIIEDKFRELWL